MKRCFIFALAMAMLVTLAACSGGIDPYEVTLAAEDADHTQSTVALPTEITFKQMAVFESDDYDIKITGIIPDAPEGYILSVSVSNNTEYQEVKKTQIVYQTDEDGEKIAVGEEEIVERIGTAYLVTAETAVVNGKEIAVSFRNEVAADERSFDQILLDKKEIDGLGAITEIELQFKVYITREEDYLISEINATVYPYGDLENME